MKADISPAEQRKPLIKSSVISMRYLNQRMQLEASEILEADAEAQGLVLADGWRFDQQGQAWVLTEQQ